MPYKNPAVQREFEANWRRLNRAKTSDYGKKYRRLHPDRKAASCAKWEKAHQAERNAYSDEWSKANKESRRKTARKINLRKKYGLSLEQYQSLLQAQKNRCQICSVKFNDAVPSDRPCIDHCGKAGHVRAILCTRCNSGIAMFRHSTTITLKAAVYLSSEVLFNGH